ncbi:hypothetical protein QBC33DRAFT_554698 [Phialemonium atrogriseum]|uniref:Uncharacterized protein n=1 Tax=Phialemonium atrogriseum TaxID=1093897 RepID=A0AAJ0FKX2_9PEZI|nr:uncharacterized protein QBC33DRAFT_554698 [Phialemonium atrogriseum]KAK1771537.1 hypothetical protein QBC33DRAFT_554698 [Phialemonium atrogriseum]
MQFSTSVSNLLLGLMGAWSCAAAPAEQVRQDTALITPLPPTCTQKALSCYTHTAFTTPECGKCTQPTDLMCPMYIKVTTTQVPCSTNCCPTTPTHVVTRSCLPCPTGCVIPTETVTQTTGCRFTILPVASATLIPGKA